MKLFSLAENNKEAVRRPDVNSIKSFLMNFVKITEFDTSSENTFYREREWRKLGDFEFGVEDVAAVVVPELFIDEIRKHLDEEGYPRSISVVSWEFVEQA